MGSEAHDPPIYFIELTFHLSKHLIHKSCNQSIIWAPDKALARDIPYSLTSYQAADWSNPVETRTATLSHPNGFIPHRYACHTLTLSSHIEAIERDIFNCGHSGRIGFIYSDSVRMELMCDIYVMSLHCVQRIVCPLKRDTHCVHHHMPDGHIVVMYLHLAHTFYRVLRLIAWI